MRSILTKNKILKEKKLKTGVLQLIELNDYCVALVFKENERIKKAKVYTTFNDNKIKKTVIKYAKQEFKKWLNIYWKFGYLAEDDSQDLDKFYNRNTI